MYGGGCAHAKGHKADPVTKSIPIVVLTASARKEDEEKIRQAGFDGYITKPIHVRGFLEKVAGYLLE
jgi:two-component system cell cycle response regulator DivK